MNSGVLYPCHSIEDRSLLWGMNTANEPVILTSVEVQTYFDQLYKISHDYDYKRELCPD
jgi:hypothetical protein